jgi:hypothetical protein
MLAHQSEFYRMGKEILAAVPESSRGWEAILGAAPEPGEGWETDDGTVDGFRKYRDEHGQPVVVITLVCWHSIHRFAYNMLGWQVEFADMGRTILRSHRKAVGRETWKQIWEMYHGEAEKPMTFHWGREDD